MRTILCYGDSNTYGSNPDGVHRFDCNTRWPRVLQKQLGDDYYVIEEGLPGRTLVNFDPIEEFKSGKTYLIPCLQSHRPLDLVIISLGTNNLKPRFSLTAYEIAAALENLILTVKQAQAGADFGEPKLLVIVPPPVSTGKVYDEMNYMFAGSQEISRQLPFFFKRVCDKYGVDMLDIQSSVEVSEEDGVHFSAKGHAQLAELVEREVRRMLV